jgi:hypothetical protein
MILRTIGRSIFWVLGAVELAVDAYGAVRRWVSPREKPFPLKRRAAPPRPGTSPGTPPGTPPARTGIR